MSTLAAAEPAQIVEWRRTLIRHAQVKGRCPKCRTRRRCWPWAFAFADLVAHGIDPFTPAHTTAGPTGAGGGTEGGSR